VKRFASDTELDREPLRALLERLLPGPRTVLEVGAGTGQHAAYFAAKLPWLTWIPSDADAAAVESVAAWRAEAALPNLRPALLLDVTRDPWELPGPVDAVVALKLVDTAPWKVAVGLLGGCGRHLPAGAPLVVAGGGWAGRDLNEVQVVAQARGLSLEERVELARDRFAEVWRRAG
jgi:SAM-dependent methyltransferase